MRRSFIIGFSSILETILVPVRQLNFIYKLERVVCDGKTLRVDIEATSELSLSAIYDVPDLEGRAFVLCERCCLTLAGSTSPSTPCCTKWPPGSTGEGSWCTRACDSTRTTTTWSQLQSSRRPSRSVSSSRSKFPCSAAFASASAKL